MAPNEDHKERVADAVAAMLRDKGISHETAADRTGIPYRTLRRRLAGHGKAFDIDELAQIARLLGVTITALITHESPESEMAS